MAHAQQRTSAPEVFSITGVRKSPQQDLHDRTVKYVIAMLVRTACFIGGVLSAVVLHLAVLTAVLLVGAFVLPYVAVLIANAGRERPAVAVPAWSRRGPRQPVEQTALTAADPAHPRPGDRPAA